MKSLLKSYMTKPVERLAIEITPDMKISIDECEQKYFVITPGLEPIVFTASSPVMFGDFVVYLNRNDIYHVPREVFLSSYEMGQPATKTLHNSDSSGAKQNVSDLKTYGDGDMFKLLCKASSKKEQWMKSTKAMEIAGVGCVVQVTTQQGDHIAEAVTFVPNTIISPEQDNGGRKLVSLT